jgi:hypothetical protein
MTTDTTTALPALPKIELWTIEKLREGLMSSEHDKRIQALAMSVQPDTPVDEIVTELAACAAACRSDPIALQVAAVALGNVKGAARKSDAANALATMATPDHALAVRIFSAHGFAQLGAVPQAAWPALCQMLLNEDSTLRQVALRAATPVATQGASAIAAAVAAASPEKWTTEALAALALSAGSSSDGMQRVEQYILRTLQGQALMPAGIAGYSALARVNPSGVAPQALAKIASAEDNRAALAAILAISQLGENGRAAIPGLVLALGQTEDPEREEALCRALVALRAGADDIVLPRTLQRIEHGTDRVVAAHALLLSMHAKTFARAAPIVAQRHSKSSVALQSVLDALHVQLAGRPLTEPTQGAAPRVNS